MLYDIVWSPEGRTVRVVDAVSNMHAKKQTPLPYKKFMGEVYAIEHTHNEADMSMGYRCRYCNQSTVEVTS